MSSSRSARPTEFPSDFVWGAASSSYQIEGGAAPDQRGLSIWDTFCRRPGAIHGGHTGEIACDHFNRCSEDVEVMQRIGLRAYRFSVSWPRVLPNGSGAVNDAGLSFYDRLVDELLAAGIEPWLTLYHWDLPDALQQRGGWQNREIADWFGEYASVVARRLSDRVRHWITLNEPQVFLCLGLGDGTHAPGLKLSRRELFASAHHALLAHGRAVQQIRAASRRPMNVGWAPAVRVNYPITESPADVEAARRASLATGAADLWDTSWFADPIHFGRYVEGGLNSLGADAPTIAPHDLECIREPVDFIGVNIYSGTPTRSGESGEPVTFELPTGGPRSALNWPVAPESLRWGPRFLWDRYQLPIVVTENGMSNLDWVSLDGRVHDPQRIDYTSRYLLELRRAVADGVDVRGYFHWSLMDNFEWAEGYKERFGLVHVDYETQRRTMKDSAHWFRSVIHSNGALLREAGAVIGATRVADARELLGSGADPQPEDYPLERSGSVITSPRRSSP